MNDRNESLLAWQWKLYAAGHRDRKNLLLHACTVPVFLAGTVMLVAAPFAWPLAPAGLVAMVMAMAAQGRGHKGEETAPVPFRGPGDVVARIFAEQWITFPRYVASGRFAKAWKAS